MLNTPGGVDEQPRGAELSPDAGRSRAYRDGVADIHAQADGVGQLRGKSPGVTCAGIQAGHREPVRREPPADGAANAACRAGNRGDLLPGTSDGRGLGHAISATERVSRMAAQNER